jgi:hypothetical protein
MLRDSAGSWSADPGWNPITAPSHGFPRVTTEDYYELPLG